MSATSDNDLMLLERTLEVFENVAKNSEKLENPESLKLAEKQAGDFENAARIIQQCQIDIDRAIDRDQHKKSKMVVDRIFEIVRRLYQIFKNLAKIENQSDPMDFQYGKDRGEKGENLAQCVASALRWYANGCERKLAENSSGNSENSKKSKLQKQASEDWDLPRVPVIKAPEIGEEEIQRQYEQSTWAANVKKIQELFAMKK
ncbi:Protein CBG25768 [Caenorhabditis briggsae]|uniref:Uncharacterized protein n=2 Tax=Caenorhabditis briggsae TaxID=6238 RepID=A0AAE9JAJ7_CAEBR|nr:Protein CBG25768 [Caenorhabditis briggsae]UMM20471.1 hypothetical protein L5515_015734 [Caenorhabditis briggsae]CAS00377.1 Protein CBG25768 [Caenorhabditis briggsae]